MAKCILELNGVRVSFADRQVLDLDSLAVYDGDRPDLLQEEYMRPADEMRKLSNPPAT